MRKRIIAVCTIISVLMLSGCSNGSDDKQTGINQVSTKSEMVDIFNNTEDVTTSFIDNGNSSMDENNGETDSNEKYGSFIISIGGQEFSLPESADDVIKKCASFGGRVITAYNNEPFTIDSNSVDYMPTDFGHVGEENLFMFGFINKTDIEQSAEDCYVVGMRLSLRQYIADPIRDYLPDVLLPNGISFYSSKDEIIAAYGQPYGTIEDEDDGNYYQILYYNMTDELEVRFFVDDNGVFDMEIFLTEEYDVENGDGHRRPQFY